MVDLGGEREEVTEEAKGAIGARERERERQGRQGEEESSSQSKTYPDARRSVGGASLLALGSGLSSTCTPARLARATSAYGGARSQKMSAAALILVFGGALAGGALIKCCFAGGEGVVVFGKYCSTL